VANIKEVTVRINVDTGEVKDASKDFDNLNKSVTTGGKQMSSSMTNLKGSLIGVGAALGGLAALKAIVGDAAKRIIAFEKSISSLSAITGAVGKDLDTLKGKVLDVAKNTKKSATEIAKAFELVGSAQPQLLENADALALVTTNAITLAKASGLDLTAAVAATTTGLAQFNIKATDSAQVIDALAAGAKFGASAIPETTAAIEKFGAVANASNVTIQDSVALIETLATKQLTGAEAGNNLKNVILKLKNEGKGFVDGQFNINAALEETKAQFDGIEDPVERSKAQTKLFGLESVTAGQILLDNIGTFEDFQGKVSEAGVAMAQAIIQTDNLATKTEQLDATYESFILSLEDGTGGLSEFAKGMVDAASNTLTFLTNLNNGKGIVSSFQELLSDQIQTSGALEEQSKALGISQKDLAQAYQNNGDVLTVLSDKLGAGEITLEQYRLLVEKLARGNEEVAETTEDVTGEIVDETAAITSNNKVKEEQLSLIQQMIQARKEQRDVGLEEGEAEEEDALDLEAFTDEELEKVAIKEEARRLDDENRKALEDEISEAQLATSEAEFAADEEIRLREEADHQQKLQRNLEIGTAAADLAGALSGLAKKGSAEAKALATVQVIINGAIAITQALAQLGPIAGALAVGAIVATTAVQLQKINSAKALKDGEVLISGEGTETSDSIPAMLSKNESVINAKSSKKHTAALRAINSDRFDEYLNRVVMQRMYMTSDKPQKQQIASKTNDINFPKGYNINNTKAISKPIVDAIEDANFLKGAGWD